MLLISAITHYISNTKTMLTKVISGGETGVDQIALEAAKRCGIETGGNIGQGFRTEKGSDPSLGEKYGLVELGPEFNNTSINSQHVKRSMKNVDDADGTLILGLMRNGSIGGPGTKKTLGYALIGKWEEGNEWMLKHTIVPYRPVLLLKIPDMLDGCRLLHEFIMKHNIKTLNVAGPRGSKMSPSADDHLERLITMFKYTVDHSAAVPSKEGTLTLLNQHLTRVTEQLQRAQLDFIFASAMVEEYIRVRERMERLCDVYDKMRDRKDLEIRSFGCVLDGMVFQKDRARAREQTLELFRTLFQNWIQNIDMVSTSHIKQKLEEMKKAEENIDYLLVFSEDGPSKRKRV